MKATEIFRSLSDETRLRIVYLLLKAEEDLCCCELSNLMEEPQYKISRHLKILRQTGLIEQRRQGRRVYFSIASPRSMFERNLYRAVISVRQFLDRAEEDERNLQKLRL